MEERRQVHRWKIGRDAKIGIEGETGRWDCWVRDIHTRGMQIAMSSRLPKRDLLKMTLAINQGLALSVEAEVPWCREYQGARVYGVSFSKISDADKDQIYQFVCSHFPDQLKTQWWSGLGEEGERL